MIQTHQRSFLAFLFFLSILTGQVAHAQSDDAKPFIITPSYHNGFIIAHHSDMLYLTQGRVNMGEVCLAFPTHGESFWNQLFNFPEPGVSLCFFDLGNPQNLGNLYSICPYIDFPLNKSMKTRFCLRAGGGISYLTKPFDRETNYKNIAIGSHLNGFMNFRITLKQELTPRLRLDLGVGLSHCSNAAFVMPNLGLNIPTVDIGIGYGIRPCPTCTRRDTLPVCDRQPFLGIGFMGALSQVNPPGGIDYPGIGISAMVYRRWNHKNLWGIGLEMFYNEANYREIVRTDASVRRSRYLQPGTKVSYSLCVGRVSMPVELGFYFYDKVSGEPFPMYEQIGLRYQASRHILVGTSIKTYFARAEFFEWGITYRLFRTNCKS